MASLDPDPHTALAASGALGAGAHAYYWEEIPSNAGVASSGGGWGMNILRPHHRPAESETPGTWPGDLCLNKSSR